VDMAGLAAGLSQSRKKRTVADALRAKLPEARYRTEQPIAKEYVE